MTVDSDFKLSKKSELLIIASIATSSVNIVIIKSLSLTTSLKVFDTSAPSSFKGSNHSVVTACATGAHSIGDASEMIKRGAADVMIAGGAEAAVCQLGVAGFCAARSLSTGY